MGAASSISVQPSGETSNISNSTFSGNQTTAGGGVGASNGGGVYNFLGTLNIEYSTFTENEVPAGKGSGIATVGDTAPPSLASIRRSSPAMSTATSI